MKSPLRIGLGVGALLLLACLGTVPAQDPVDTDTVPDGVEIQTRGPVHEAFAQPSDMKPGPGQIVPKQPPAPIPEEPPPERPEGANVQFIPGYWAWDPEDSKFLWVSGGYRNAPVGRQWVPGNWVRAEGGWRWVPGMWAPEQQQELRYTPEPPAPLQVEPTIEAPSDDSTWIAGTWVYRDTRFVWRPGYWSPFRYGRVWSPARYIWSPYGYQFCDGYWDYPWEDRGLLFAPISFYRPVYLTPGWFWRPWYAVRFGLFYDSCFYNPGSFHFYFGNYYGPRYAGYGYRPWFHGYGRYDSVFGYHRWHHGHHRDWYRGQERLYADRHAGRALAPPRNFAQQQALAVNTNKTVVNNFQAVAPLKQAKALNENVNLVRLTPAQKDTQKALMKRSQEIAATRGQPTGANVGGAQGKAPRLSESGTLKLPPPVPGTQTVRNVDNGAALPKKGLGSIGANNVPAPKIDSGIKNVTKPAPVFPSAGVGPKGSGPKIDNNKVFPPRSGDIPAPPKSFNKPDGPRPKSFEMPPPPANKSPAAPKTFNPSPPSFKPSAAPALRNADVPRSNPPAFRSADTPRTLPSAPRSFSTPRNVPSAPRISAPSSTPRYSAPSSSTPRSGGKRGQGKGK